jgi:hypothetical protein
MKMKLKKFDFNRNPKMDFSLIVGGVTPSAECTGGGCTLVGTSAIMNRNCWEVQYIYHVWDSDSVTSDGKLSYGNSRREVGNFH